MDITIKKAIKKCLQDKSKNTTGYIPKTRKKADGRQASLSTAPISQVIACELLKFYTHIELNKRPEESAFMMMY
ncbi:hypothetical protein [Echinicola strongylocentroti]|nr:hypothetical protein [Echinicola strongylocentroti]